MSRIAVVDLQIEVAESVKEKRRFWPSPQDYNEALQNPETSFADNELRSGSVQLDSLGLPRPTSGAFASVYKLQTGNKTVAVRCFLNNVRDQERRYELISDFVMNDDLPYTVSFEYQRKGIIVRGEWFPLLKMEWVDGVTLERYVAKHIGDSSALRALRDRFKEMCLHISAAGIAHGDLQHGNIIVTESGELRLVDYDGMFVPRMSGWASNELGHRNFQHPKRDATHFGPFLDSFSSWSIYTSLTALIEEPSLFKLPHVGNDCLIFRKEDYVEWVISPVVKRLAERTPSELTQAVGCLLWHVQAEPWQNLPLTAELNAEMIAATKTSAARFEVVSTGSRTCSKSSEDDEQALMTLNSSEQVLFEYPVRLVESVNQSHSAEIQSPYSGLNTAIVVSLIFGILGCVMSPVAGIIFFAISFSYFSKYISPPPISPGSPELVAKGTPCQGAVIDAIHSKDNEPVVRYKFFIQMPDGTRHKRLGSVVVSESEWTKANRGDMLVVLYLEQRNWYTRETSNASIPYKYAKFRAVPPPPVP